MGVRRRFFRVARVFTGMLFDFAREYSLMQRIGYKSASLKMKRRHQRRADMLYSLAVDFGGVYIKLCQFFSARRDIFPEEYIRRLSPLQDSVPPVAFSEIEGVLNREYDAYNNIFAEIDPVPLASASLGQVHGARLISGEEVVVKVLKPGVEESIDTDFAILYFVFRFITRFETINRHGDFMAILDELVTVTGDEMNFIREASVMKVFRKELSAFSYVTLPEVYESLSTRRVLVMSRCPGDRVSEQERWISRNNDPLLISRRLIEIYMEQLLRMPYIHFDPHPGNILITENSNIVLLDFGMAGEIGAKNREGLRIFLEALIDRDARGMVEAVDSMGMLRKNINRYSMVPVVQFILNEFLGALKFDRELIYTADFSPIKDELVEMIYTQPFNLNAEWAYTGKAVGVLFAVISKLNPEFNIYGELKPYIEKALKEEIPGMARRAAKNAFSTAKTAAGLPRKIDDFINNFESGYYRFKVDYRELIEEIDRVRTFAVRFTAFLMALGCGLGALLGYEPMTFRFNLLIGLTVPALFTAVFFRSRVSRRKAKIREMLN